MSKSTPTPWKFWRDMDPKQPLEIHGQSADPICQIAMENTQALANAGLIIRAVNSHAKLVEACKLALDSFGGLQPERYMEASRAQFDALTEALSLAQGGEK